MHHAVGDLPVTKAHKSAVKEQEAELHTKFLRPILNLPLAKEVIMFPGCGQNFGRFYELPFPRYCAISTNTIRISRAPQSSINMRRSFLSCVAGECGGPH